MRRLVKWLGALFLAGSVSLASAGAQPSDVIRVGVANNDQISPLIYGVKAGIYKKYGLNVELVSMPSGAAIAAGMSGGSLDLAQGTPLVISLAVGRGLPFVVIGSLSYYNADKPDIALLVLASSNVRTPKDLEGQTLGATSLSDMFSIATFAWFEQNAVDRSAVKFVEVPAPAALAAMEQNRIVAQVIYEPFYTDFMASGKLRVLGYPFSAIAKHFADSLLFGTSKWIGDHPDAVAKFLRASQEASVYIAAHETESAGLIAEFAGMDASNLAKIRHGGRGVILSPSDIQPIIDAAAKYKVIPKAFSATDMICSCALRK